MTGDPGTPAEEHSSAGAPPLGIGSYAEVMAALREAIRAEPRDAGLHVNLGNVLAGAGRGPEAEVPYRQIAMVLDRGGEVVHVKQRPFLHDPRRAQEAEAAYRQAIGLDPGNARAHNGLAVVLAAAGKQAEAEAAYLQATRLEPGNACIVGNFGCFLVDTGRAGQAELVMQSVIAADPGSPRAWVNLGDARLDAGRPAEAGAAYQEAFRLDPGSAPACNGLGRALEAMGKPRQTQAAFRKASSIRPDLNPWTLIPVHPDDSAMQDYIRRSRGKRPPPLGGRQR